MEPGAQPPICGAGKKSGSSGMYEAMIMAVAGSIQGAARPDL